MLIRPRRLEKLLCPEGFHLEEIRQRERTIIYARPCTLPDLTEAITIACDPTRRGEKVFAQLEVFVGHGYAGVSESEFLAEAGDVLLRSPEEAIAWERRLAEVAPARAAQFAKSKGPELLARTAAGRAAARRYLELMGGQRDLDELERALAERSTAAQKAEAERLARATGVMCVPGGQRVFDLAALGMVVFGDEVEGRKEPFTGIVPMNDTEFIIRIRFLVHLLTMGRETGP